MERSKLVARLPKVFAMNTFFFGKFQREGYAGVRRWTRNDDIFSYDIVLVPIHIGGIHWCMSVIHMGSKTIQNYDSMGYPNNAVSESLAKYVSDESMDKKNVALNINEWRIRSAQNCPQQENQSDCGVFSCAIAEFITRDAPIAFDQQHMQYFRSKMIFEISVGKLVLGFNQ